MSSGMKTASLKKAPNNLSKSLQKSRAPKSSARAFLKRFQEHVKKNSFFSKKERLLVAVSGGPDSMALLSALLYVQPLYKWELGIAHVNYGLRGEDSDADAVLVKETAKLHSLPFHLLQKKVGGKSSEDALRKIRYEFFEKLAKKHKYTSVVLAHHLDDQAETILLRLVRGAGPTGLQGMKEKRTPYIRPFLTFSKQEILQYLEKANLPFRHDTSNDEKTYLRNKIRHELIPLLASYNPNIKKSLVKMAKELGEVEKKVLKNTTPLHLIKSTPQASSFLQSDWDELSLQDKKTAVRALFQKKSLTLPSQALTHTLVKDFSTQKKGLKKEYSRLRVSRNDGTIHVHFNEIET